MPFDEKPSPGQQPQAEGEGDEFTRLFGALEPAAPSASQPFAPQPEPTKAANSPADNVGSSAAGEFTRIFQQIAKPTSRPPQLDEPPPLSAAAEAGEFTQFFHAAKPTTEPTPAAKPVPPVAAAPPPVFTAPEPAPASSRSADPDSFTQIFSQPLTGAGFTAREAPPQPPVGAAIQPPVQAPVQATPQAPAPHPGPPAASLPFADRSAAIPARHDSFAAPELHPGVPSAGANLAASDVSPTALTQIFQMPESQPVRSAAVPARMPEPVRPSPPSASSGPGEFTRLMQGLDAGPAPTQPPSSPPANSFGFPEPQAGPGEFTRLMQGLNANTAPELASPLRAANPPQATEFPAGPGEFTRLMQGLEGSSSGASGLPSMPQGQPALRDRGGAAPFGGPGEFTRAMQSLGSAPPVSPSGAPPMAAPLDLPHVAGQESEFTRVMRGSSLRETNTSVPAPQAAAAAPSAPAAEKPKDKTVAGPEAKPKKWLLILLAANLVLLLALIVLAFLFLRHRH